MTFKGPMQELQNKNGLYQQQYVNPVPVLRNKLVIVAKIE